MTTIPVVPPQANPAVPKQANLVTPTSPTPTPAAPRPAQPSIVAGVHAAGAKIIPAQMLAKLEKQKFNTNDIVSPFFRCLLYGDIDSGKTVTAARFGTPENTRIILTRQKEQVLGLRGEGYKVFHANSVEMLRYAVMYPEVVWPEWAEVPDRTLIIDDVTQVRDMLNDDNTSETVQDIRRISKMSKDELREIIQLSALSKPMNLIIVALERSWEEGKEIKVSPDLPPAMSNMLRADLEYVLYLKKTGPDTRQISTTLDREPFIKKDDKGKEQTYWINRFARTKIPTSLAGKGIVKPKEPADLRALWERVKAAK